jgi:hypothetical protein
MMRSPHFANKAAGRARTLSRAAAGCGLAAMLAAMLILPPASVEAAAQVPEAAQQCLSCHAMPTLSKTMGDGGRMPLHVPGEAFAGSVHAMMGCAGCHRDVNPTAHPAMQPYGSVREYSVSKADVCKSCHAAKYEQYHGSIHAILVDEGSLDAPVCASCHDVHAIKPMAELEVASGGPCKACHEDIFEAYQGSVHGQARTQGGAHSAAPMCTDCHQAHEVTTLSYSDRLQSVCMGCHETARVAHQQWLPNSGLHLDMVACPACHSPLAERRVDLRLYDRNSRTLIADATGNSGFVEKAREIDVAGDGLDPLELWSLVREANREGVDTSVTLHGRLEVRSGVEAHQLALKTEAVRDCDTCHRKGAAPYEHVTISVTSPDGRRIRYAAEQETLTSAVSVDSVSGFYTAGGTRIKLLDGLLAFAVLAGLGIPLTHMSVRKWFRNKS